MPRRFVQQTATLRDHPPNEGEEASPARTRWLDRYCLKTGSTGPQRLEKPSLPRTHPPGEMELVRHVHHEDGEPHGDRFAKRCLDPESEHVTSGMVQGLHGEWLRGHFRVVCERAIRFSFGDVESRRRLDERIKLGRGVILSTRVIDGVTRTYSAAVFPWAIPTVCVQACIYDSRAYFRNIFDTKPFEIGRAHV